MTEKQTDGREKEKYRYKQRAREREEGEDILRERERVMERLFYDSHL